MTETMGRYDVIIVGGGPAGLCAAMYAGRGRLKTLLLERGMPGGELLNTEVIEDYIGFEHILGRELADKMTKHAQKFGAEFLTDTVATVERDGDGGFVVRTELERTFHTPAVIVTAGGTPTKLNVPGEKEYAGQGVSYCAVCDGAFFKGADLAVVGIGAVPNTELAREAGLACDDGIVVDDRCRTTDPRLFAAGDWTRPPDAAPGRRPRPESGHDPADPGTRARH